MTDLCDALSSAWEKHQTIHGDLCPQNLLVTEADEFRVLDFGLARSLYEVPGPTGAPLATGTQAYLSPERARGLSATVADDVYGFGATVYELLTSKPVFYQGDLVSQLESVVPPSMAERRAQLGITGDPMPKEWEEVIAACLAKRRENRPRDLREVGERLGLLTPRLGEVPKQGAVLPRTPDVDLAPTVASLPQAATPSTEISAPLREISMAADTVCGEVLETVGAAQKTPPPTATTGENQSARSPSADETVAALEALGAPTAPTATPIPVPVSEPAPASVAPALPTPPAPATPLPVTPAPEPPMVQGPPSPPTHVPSKIAPKTPAPEPPTVSKATMPWLIPTMAGLLIVGGLSFLLWPGKSKDPAVAIQTPVPIPATPIPATPTPKPAASTSAPVTPPPVQGREATVSNLTSLTDKSSFAEVLFLTGEFRVSSAVDRVAILRPTDKKLASQVRVTASFLRGAEVPVERSTVQWSRESGLRVREVRRGKDGQLNIEVEQTRRP
jgi:hypothetical protein